MKSLLRFFYQNRNGVLFLVLELLSLFLVFNHQSHKLAKHLNSTNKWIGKGYAFIAAVKTYPLLKKAYQELLEENKILRAQLIQAGSPTSPIATQEQVPQSDRIIAASVVNNSIIYSKNYLTIDKGTQQGIMPDMAVISAEGVVGRIKAVSKHFATVTSILHVDMLVSAKVGKSGTMGTIRWAGHNPFEAQLLYIPRHVTIEPGDPVWTSGYNAIFKEGILMGHVKQVELRKEALFYHITVKLSTDFSRLRHVYVIKDKINPERDSLEQLTRSYYE